MNYFPERNIFQNSFLPITHLFKTSWTPSPVATPPKSTMPRRSKGSKHGVNKNHFWNFFDVQKRFLLITHLFKTSWTPSLVATPPKSTMPRRSKGSKHGVFFSFFRARFFCRARLFSSFFLSGPTFFVVILDVSGFKTVTIRSGVKNPI